MFWGRINEIIFLGIHPPRLSKKHMHLLVSVIIPTYNRAAVVARAIKSVMAQDYEPLEIIVVDDASSDDTRRVVDGLRDARIRYIARSENKGAAAARNTGIRAAQGAFIAFLDSDDEYLAGKLRAQVHAFETLDPATGLVFVNYCEIGRDRSVRFSPEVKAGYVKVGLDFPASISCNPPSAWMVRRDCLDAAGFFDEGLWTMEDLDMFARLVRKAPAYFLADILLHKHVYTCQAGKVPDKYAEETGERILRKWLPEMRRDKKFLFKFYSMMAKDMARAGNRQKACRFLRRAYFLNPLRFDMLGRMVKVASRR